MDFIPVTEEEAREMLHEAGFSSFDALLSHIKPKIERKLLLPDGVDEKALLEKMQEIAKLNKPMKYFVGSGSYWHYIPAAVEKIVARAEFYTAYTPYQPEISQGILQAIYEYQTLICLLTGMQASNASLYDGASAVPEAVNMARYIKSKPNVYAAGLFEHYEQVLKTYAEATGYKVFEEHQLEQDEASICAVIVQYPDKNGELRDLKQYKKLAEEKDALFIVVLGDPTMLGILKPPSEFGADIVVGDAQAFGNHVAFGGPYVGYISTKEEFVKYLPGRISGKTLDTHNKSGYMLTLQAREQHIRRHKALSNICSNQALCALATTAYLGIMGKTGLKTVGKLNLYNAHLLANKLRDLGLQIKTKNFYNEFTISLEGKGVGSSWLIKELAKKSFLFGHKIGKNNIVVCATEMNTREQIDELVEHLSQTL